MVELNPWEFGLLLGYGYPFREQEQKLRASKAVKRIHRVHIGRRWLF